MGSVYKCKEHEEGTCIIILVTSTSHYIDSPDSATTTRVKNVYMQLKHLNKQICYDLFKICIIKDPLMHCSKVLYVMAFSMRFCTSKPINKSLNSFPMQLWL